MGVMLEHNRIIANRTPFSTTVVFVLAFMIRAISGEVVLPTTTPLRGCSPQSCPTINYQPCQPLPLCVPVVDVYVAEERAAVVR